MWSSEFPWSWPFTFFALCHAHCWHRHHYHRREDDLTQHGVSPFLFAEDPTLSDQPDGVVEGSLLGTGSQSVDIVPCMFLSFGMARDDEPIRP